MAVNLDLAADAITRLEAAGYKCGATSPIVSVDRDSILFLGVLGRPHTAWLHAEKIVSVEDGFQSVEPDGLHLDLPVAKPKSVA